MRKEIGLALLIAGCSGEQEKVVPEEVVEREEFCDDIMLYGSWGNDVDFLNREDVLPWIGDVTLDYTSKERDENRLVVYVETDDFDNIKLNVGMDGEERTIDEICTGSELRRRNSRSTYTSEGESFIVYRAIFTVPLDSSYIAEGGVVSLETVSEEGTDERQVYVTPKKVIEYNVENQAPTIRVVRHVGEFGTWSNGINTLSAVVEDDYEISARGRGAHYEGLDVSLHVEGEGELAGGKFQLEPYASELHPEGGFAYTLRCMDPGPGTRVLERTACVEYNGIMADDTITVQATDVYGVKSKEVTMQVSELPIEIF